MKTFFESSDFDLLANPSDAEIAPLTVAEVEMFLALDLTRQPGAEILSFDERLAFARRLAWSSEGGAGVEMRDGTIFAQREFLVDGRPVAKIGRWTDYNRDGVSRGWYAAIAK